jgi:integrase
MKFTMDSVAALQMPAGKSDHIEWDDSLPGFGVRLRGTSKRWTVQYRVGTKQRRESLGDVRKVKLEDARKIARQRFALVELGTDPAAERAEKRAGSSPLNFGSVVARYLAAKEDVLRPSTYKAAKRYLTLQWKQFFDRPIDSIKRADIAARLQEIIKQHGRTSAARSRGNLSALFSWSMKEGLSQRDSNPVIATHDPDEGIQSRDRVLSDRELALVWKESGDGRFGTIIRMLILTGARREEIGALRWSEVDLETGMMTIPGTRTKNHRTLTLTLPPAALDILQSVPCQGGSEYVFGTRSRPFQGWGYGKVSLDHRITIAEQGKPLPGWVIHDLRRTVRSGLGRLGVRPDVAELVVNHAKGGIQATYDRYTYETEIKAALALWAEHVLAVAGGRSQKVVSLRARELR